MASGPCGHVLSFSSYLMIFSGLNVVHPSLQKVFNIKTLKDCQLRVLAAHFEGRDVMAQSCQRGTERVCAQLPAVRAKKATLVFVPLRVLARDQSTHMRDRT